MFLVHKSTTAPRIYMAIDLRLKLSVACTEMKTNKPFYETNVRYCFAVRDAGMPVRAATLEILGSAMVVLWLLFV